MIRLAVVSTSFVSLLVSSMLSVLVKNSSGWLVELLFSAAITLFVLQL